MAKRIVETFVDDLTGEDIPAGTGGTFVYALADRARLVPYELDLSDENYRQVQGRFTDLIEAGRRLPVVPLASSKVGSAPARVPARAIRDWAAAKGIKVSDRGRIAQDVVDRFHAEAGNG